jgi:hypothetical protein
MLYKDAIATTVLKGQKKTARHNRAALHNTKQVLRD